MFQKPTLFTNLIGVMKAGEGRSMESLNYLDREEEEDARSVLRSDDMLDRGSSWRFQSIYLP